MLAALGVEFDLWLAEDQLGPAAAAVVLKKDGRPLETTHPLCLYQGLLLSERVHALPPHSRPRTLLPLLEELLTELTQAYERLAFGLHHTLDDLRGVQWFNYGAAGNRRFRFDLYYTGLIAMGDDFEEYLDQVRAGRRADWKRAGERGLRSETSRDLELLASLDDATFERQDLVRPTGERELVRSVAQAALEGGFGELFVCRDAGGQPLSATVFLFDARSAYYLIAANAPAGRAQNAGTFLFLESLRRLQQRGVRSVDVVGVNSPNRGDFKTSFNARSEPYFIVTWPDGGGA